MRRTLSKISQGAKSHSLCVRVCVCVCVCVCMITYRWRHRLSVGGHTALYVSAGGVFAVCAETLEWRRLWRFLRV